MHLLCNRQTYRFCILFVTLPVVVTIVEYKATLPGGRFREETSNFKSWNDTSKNLFSRLLEVPVVSSVVRTIFESIRCGSRVNTAF